MNKATNDNHKGGSLGTKSCGSELQGVACKRLFNLKNGSLTPKAYVYR